MELDNPNIVKLYEIYEWNQSVYLVSEYPFNHAAFAREESSLTGSINRAVSAKSRQESSSGRWWRASTISTFSRLHTAI
jgi:serine/threonine protein kinase